MNFLTGVCNNPTFSKILAGYVGNQMMVEEVDDQEEAEERIDNTNWDFYHKFTDSSFFFLINFLIDFVFLRF